MNGGPAGVANPPIASETVRLAGQGLMTNFVPGARVMVRELETQNSPFTFAPTEVLPVLSDVTLPFTSSSSIELVGQLVPVLVVSLKLVLSLLPHLIVPEVAPSVPVVLPLPSVFPVQPLNLIVADSVEAFAVPFAVEHLIPVGVAPAGPAVRTVIPASGTRAAEAAITASMIRFFSIFATSFI